MPDLQMIIHYVFIERAKVFHILIGILT